MTSHIKIEAAKKLLASKGYAHIPPLVLWEMFEAVDKAWAEAEARVLAQQILAESRD